MAKIEFTYKEIQDVHNALRMAIDGLNEDLKEIQKAAEYAEKNKLPRRKSFVSLGAYKVSLKNQYTQDVKEIDRFRKDLVKIDDVLRNYLFG